MIKQITVTVFVAGLLLTGCRTGKDANQSNQQEKSSSESQATVNYTIAKNYFVKSSARTVSKLKIETEEQFNEVFGMATTMGDAGKPTPIDFSKQFVIAVILPESEVATLIEPVSLNNTSKNELTFNYRLTVGNKQSFTSVPFCAIIVNKADNGNVIFKESK